MAAAVVVVLVAVVVLVFVDVLFTARVVVAGFWVEEPEDDGFGVVVGIEASIVEVMIACMIESDVGIDVLACIFASEVDVVAVGEASVALIGDTFGVKSAAIVTAPVDCDTEANAAMEDTGLAGRVFGTPNMAADGEEPMVEYGTVRF